MKNKFYDILIIGAGAAGAARRVRIPGGRADCERGRPRSHARAARRAALFRARDGVGCP